MTKTIGAIYDTLSAMAGFIKSLTGWFGFGPMVALFFLLFFFKLFQSVLGAGRILSFLFSFVTLTALWLTWNLSYYEEYKILEIVKIYGFIFLHLAAVYLLYHFLSWSGKAIYRRIKNRRIHPDSPLQIYEKIDDDIALAKKYIRMKDIKGAAKILGDLHNYIQQDSKTPPAARENSTPDQNL